MSSLIIESPHRQGMVRRLVQGLITLFFWGLWLYLLSPLIAPLMVAMGLDHAVFVYAKPVDYPKFISPILLFIAVIIFSMELWVRYNVFLYRRSKWQNTLNVVYRNQLAQHFGVSSNELAGWHRSERLTIRLTECGKIFNVEVNKSPEVPVPKPPKNKQTVSLQDDKKSLAQTNSPEPRKKRRQASKESRTSPLGNLAWPVRQ